MSWWGTKFEAIKKAYNNLDKAIYPLIGLPSYEKYLEHFKKNHPEGTPLSRKEFFKEAQDSKEKNIKC
ncbi:KCU-star family selenoprotein [Campylobacter geochelonis]|uniref:Uncharacterized small protein n=1 Tax=Campylobacter geochelonis TaxID=1780362 RepID=A0A128EPE4_9BACT|nr:KCU-star family selenoprotein [Campylobacter geochelonis]QKF70765.1 DUF466 domain-containing protein [Campylobacter geochelonis]CZE47307.1 Uncharacterized small protein [Campylobacter geochelonis]CZE48621.1 Uncharacterized small protein [Campylobacter geochelonis]CZE50534.1 Uncharacterized small protein [Campylobacter geochelonis]